MLSERRAHLDPTDKLTGFQRWPKRVVALLGIAVTLLGCVVIIGWYAHMPSLVQVLPTLVPMQYNTALGFALSGLGLMLLLLRHPRPTFACLGLVAILGLLTLIQYLTGLDFGIDQALMKHYILVETSHPGRMAPNTALAFLITGAALCLRATYDGKIKWRRLVPGYLGAAILLLGTVAFVGYMVGAETGYGWGRFTRMAVHTAVGFMMLGSAILILTWPQVVTMGDVSRGVELYRDERQVSAAIERRRIITVSILIMSAVSLVVGISIVRELYHKSLEQERLSLIQTVSSWAELIDVLATHNLEEHLSEAEELTLQDVADAYKRFGGFRETGEIVLARREGKGIDFLLEFRKTGFESKPKILQPAADWAEPMRKALAGEAGTLVGRDYRGEQVLAAYRYIESLKIGIVAKVDLEETKRPFTGAALLATGIALVIIMLGSMAFILKVNPMLRQLSVTRELKQTIHDLGRILDHSWNEVHTFDADTLQLLDVSKGARRNLGYSMEELKQLTPLDLMPEFTRDQLEALIDPLRHGKKNQVTFEARQQRKDGTSYPVEVRLHLVNTEAPPVFAAIVQDISERKRYIDELERKALYDALTDLPNRSLLQERLEYALKVARREALPLALCIIDVARLREINDLMGYHNGDFVLTEIGNRLQGMLRESDTVARLSGDEFGIIMASVGFKQVHIAANKVKEIFEQPLVIGDTPLEIEAAVGIAIYPEHGDTSATLMQHADIAKHMAKYETSAYSIYDPEDDPFSLERLKRYGELRRALDEKTLTLHYQPKIDLEKGCIKSVEALARWPHPMEGMISPGEFIPMIEQSGMIRPFTFWVLEHAIQQSKVWEEQGIDLSISVNLSTRNLLDASLPDYIMELMETHQISPKRISLEITESSVMARPERALSMLAQLHDLGFNLSIDDFGTGYSSLAYLRKLPVNELKIDQSFVIGMAENENDALIVRSTIELAHNLGKTVVAEGVETEQILEMLSMMECDIGQGYHFSRPLCADELTKWLVESPWGIVDLLNA